MYIVNAFSIKMLPPDAAHTISFRPLSVTGARFLAQAAAKARLLESGVGHADTAEILSRLLGVDISMQRRDARLTTQSGPILIAQYSGPRLPEGATTLPDGASFSYWLVDFSYVQPTGLVLGALQLL